MSENTVSPRPWRNLTMWSGNLESDLKASSRKRHTEPLISRSPGQKKDYVAGLQAGPSQRLQGSSEHVFLEDTEVFHAT